MCLFIWLSFETFFIYNFNIQHAKGIFLFFRGMQISIPLPDRTMVYLY